MGKVGQKTLQISNCNGYSDFFNTKKVGQKSQKVGHDRCKPVIATVSKEIKVGQGSTPVIATVPAVFLKILAHFYFY